MSEREFFQELAKLKKLRWHLDFEEIRCARGRCPILAVFRAKFPRNHEYDNGRFLEAGEKLGLTKKTTQKIVKAADSKKWNPARSDHTARRRRLLRVCGIKEV